VTTPPLALPHRNAVLAALQSIQGVAVGEGGAPNPVPSNQMYAVLYMDPGQSSTASLADDRSTFQGLFQVTCVGPTVEKCLWVADKVRTALFGTLTVAGRAAWRPEEQGGPPVQRDDDVTPPLYYLPVQYRLQSIPA
jgi:hypothetical protein